MAGNLSKIVAEKIMTLKTWENLLLFFYVCLEACNNDRYNFDTVADRLAEI